MNVYLEGLLERVKAPIAGEQPCGENARYDARYEKSKIEIMKLTAGSEEIDWKGIVSGIDELLSQKTKDLMLAAYLSLSLLKQYEYPGLVVGFEIIDYLMETYWEEMYPPVKRMKARVNIFEWMDERLSVMIGVTKPKDEHAEELRTCKALADALPSKVQDLVKTQVTGFSRMRAEINEWIDKLPAPAPEPPPAPAPAPKPEPAASAPAPASSSPAVSGETGAPVPREREEVETVEDQRPVAEGKPKEAPSERPPAPPAQPVEMKLPEPVHDIDSISQGLTAIIKIVNLIREVQPTSPMAYRLARVIRWELVVELPAAAPDGRTRIPAPLQQNFKLMEAQLNAPNWVELTKTTEDLFASGGGWTFNLNLQRLVALGLEKQGAFQAAEAVVLETGRLLLKLPDLVDFTYDSGLPFADGETKMWARGAVERALGPGKESPGEEDADKQWLKDATRMAQQSGLSKALPIVQEAIKETRDIKRNMKRQLDVATFLFSHREYQWAMPILESLNERVEGVQLAQWDPNFCSDVWELLLKCDAVYHNGTIGDNSVNDRNLIRKKLFSVNVAKAAAVTPKQNKK